MTQPYPPYAAIEHALGEVICEACSRGVRLSNAISPFPPYDENTVVVWFFFQYETDVQAYKQDGTNAWLQDQFVEELRAAKRQFRFSMLPDVTFAFDSTENVQKNYKGSYYLRLK